MPKPTQPLLFDVPAQRPYPMALLYRVFCAAPLLVPVGKLTADMALLLRHGYCYIRNNGPEPKTHFELCAGGNGYQLLHSKGYNVPVWCPTQRAYRYA